MAQYRKKKLAFTYPEFILSLKVSDEEIQKSETVKKIKGKRKHLKFLQKLRVSKLKLVAEKGARRLVYKGVIREVIYIRYFSNFIVFAWGTKNDCLEIKKLIFNFLKSELYLYLPNEKTRILNLKNDKIKFFDFEIWQPFLKTPFSKKTVNSYEKLNKTKLNAKLKSATFRIPNLRITFSIKLVLKKLVDQGLVLYKKGKFYPTSYKVALQLDLVHIIIYLHSVFYSLAIYYGFAYN